MIQKNTKRIAVACAIALASSGAALAHAELHHASPEAGSAVSEAHTRVDEGKSQVNGNMIRIGLKTLLPGSYRVHWRVLSVDTHRSEGSFTFSVR